MTADDLLADLRREHLRLRATLARVEIIGLALSKGVMDLETALDRFAALPRLRNERDSDTVAFLEAVMRDETRRNWRRAA